MPVPSSRRLVALAVPAALAGVLLVADVPGMTGGGATGAEPGDLGGFIDGLGKGAGSGSTAGGWGGADIGGWVLDPPSDRDITTPVGPRIFDQGIQPGGGLADLAA